MLSYQSAIVLNSLDWLSLVMVDIHIVCKFPNIGNMRIDREVEEMEDSAKMAGTGMQGSHTHPIGDWRLC